MWIPSIRHRNQDWFLGTGRKAEEAAVVVLFVPSRYYAREESRMGASREKIGCGFCLDGITKRALELAATSWVTYLSLTIGAIDQNKIVSLLNPCSVFFLLLSFMSPSSFRSRCCTVSPEVKTSLTPRPQFPILPDQNLASEIRRKAQCKVVVSRELCLSFD
jgi:hypothetical protein